MRFAKKNKRKNILLIIITLIFSSTIKATDLKEARVPVHTSAREMNIVGGGHIGLIQALLAYQRAQERGEQIHIRVWEKNASITDTTAANIWNSHTPDEIVAVVPRGKDLEDKLKNSLSSARRYTH